MKWETIKEDGSVKDIPAWTGSIPLPDKVSEPIEYFRYYYDLDLLNLICKESNLFASQTSDVDLNLEVKELEVFIGIAMYMSLIKLPRSRQYWSTETEVIAVSEYMGCKRWETIKSFIHFADNEKAPAKGQPGYDKVYKIRPLLNHLNSKCNQIPMGENLCIDEQMVPYSGKRGPRYYIKGNQTPGDLRFGPYVIPLVYYTILMFVLALPQNKKVLLIADQVETLCAS